MTLDAVTQTSLVRGLQTGYDPLSYTKQSDRPVSTKKTRSKKQEKTDTVNPASQPDITAEYSIDELAREGETTVRNVRAYQDRGILPPPERRGRKGIYTDVHLRLLKLIGQLLDRGYTINNIGELLEAMEKGHDISQLMGLGDAIASPWTGEIPNYFTISELSKLFKVKITLKNLGVINQAVKLGILEREGPRFRAASPKLIHVASELVHIGIPLEDLLDILRMMRGNVQRVADELVMRIVPIFDRYDDELPPPEEVPKLADIVWRLRPLAETAMTIEAMQAVERAANKYLGDRLAYMLEHMNQSDD